MTLRLDTVSLHGRDRPLLDAVSLTLHPGEIVAVIGPNGAGKSTLLRLASGLVAPTSGTVSLDGTPIGGLPPERLAARRAMLGQDSVLRARFSVAELARLGIR
ncbi:MAG: ATP-binding cassette domain-containing protein, partial [Gluconacetobacter sp.]